MLEILISGNDEIKIGESVKNIKQKHTINMIKY